MAIWCEHVHRLESRVLIFVLRIYARPENEISVFGHVGSPPPYACPK